MKRIIVVGAGLIGMCTAIRLAARGVAVSLVDAQALGSGTSGTSFASVNASHAAYDSYYDLRVLGLDALLRLSLQWPATTSWLISTGRVHVEEDGASAQSTADHAGVLRSRGHAVVEIDRDQAVVLEPALIPGPIARRFFYYPDEAYLLTRVMLDHLAGVASDLGVTVFTEDPVIAFASTAGRDRGVQLMSGRTLEADATVICCGHWTPAVLELAGVTLPLVSPDQPQSDALGLVVMTKPVLTRLERMVSIGGLVIRPDVSGRLMLQSHVHDQRVTTRTAMSPLPEVAHDLVESACSYLQVYSRVRIESAQLCIRPLPLDGMPVVGWIGSGLYVIVAHAGATLAAILAELAAQELIEDDEVQLLARYRPARFGTKTPQ